MNLKDKLAFPRGGPLPQDGMSLLQYYAGEQMKAWRQAPHTPLESSDIAPLAIKDALSLIAELEKLEVE
jgi:hypothetical protein